MKKHQTVVLGDGAHWIWEMANSYYPNAIQILDFYHLSEYIWKVAKSYTNNEEEQKIWVNTQQQLLKNSRWETVINNCEKIRREKKDKKLEKIKKIKK